MFEDFSTFLNVAVSSAKLEGPQWFESLPAKLNFSTFSPESIFSDYFSSLTINLDLADLKYSMPVS